jgi:hypothetical protein
MLKHYILSFFLVASLSVFSQSISYTAQGRGTAIGFESDYHSLGVNSSALGWTPRYEDVKFTTGSLEFYGYMQSDSLTTQNFSDMYSSMRGQIGKQSYNSEKARELGNSMLKLANAVVRGEMDISYMNFSYQNKRFGGIAFSMIDNYRINAKVNSENANVLFKGDWSNLLDSVSLAFDGDSSKVAYNSEMATDSLRAIYALHLNSPLNFNEVTNGTAIRMAWNRVYNLGYGRKLFGKDSIFEIFGGIGARLIHSVARVDFASDGESSYLHTSLPDKASGRNGSLAQMNPLYPSSVGGFFSNPVGMGYGLDFSASALIFNKIRVAAAVNNIGSINYKQKIYKGNDAQTQTLYVEEGLDPQNFEDDIRELLSTDQFITFVEEKEVKINNPGTVRIGGSFMPIKQIQVGMELIVPYNKSNPFGLESTITAFGIEIRPVKWLALTAGYWSGGNYTGQIPLGINFILRDGRYEFGLSSRDLYSFVDGKTNNVSAAFGFARVRF